MSGPFSISEIEQAIYDLVVESKAREGHAFPTKFVWLNIQKQGFTHEDFLKGVDSLQSKGLITDDEKISDDFFAKLGGN